ncbi:MAG: DNA/RNA non-specific endonuclease [Bacteroidaceae bacterium]|nr:DNA/RNA non-specific endonuclease [Bacteroidaceae bacterium]
MKALTLVLLLAGCSSVVQDNVELMEIPAFINGEKIITYTSSSKDTAPYYTVSFDVEHRIPRWVAYELTAEESRGNVQRNDKRFRRDGNVNYTQADDSDYRGSGWTRGHMAPAGDFKWSDEGMWETFYYTNCCPQSEILNNGDWEYLESKVRELARRYGRVWVVTGPIIGKNINGTIGKGVVVPDGFFKAVLINDEGNYKAIAFTMDNDDLRHYLKDCTLSINDLEEQSGIDFFPNLSDDIEEKVESMSDLKQFGLR